MEILSRFFSVFPGFIQLSGYAFFLLLFQVKPVCSQQQAGSPEQSFSSTREISMAAGWSSDVAASSAKPEQQPDQFDLVKNGAYACYLTNKAKGDGFALNYFWNQNKFPIGSLESKWKLSGDARNGYQILVAITGKYFALSATPDAYPKMDLIKPEDNYQKWIIERLPDGYYRISNIGLLNANSPYPYLYYQSVKENLFLTGWEDAKSLNGRWHFFTNGDSKEAYDAFDNRRLTLTSFQTNRNMCLNYQMTSDATGNSYLGPCEGNLDRFVFVRAMSTAYLLKIETFKNNRKQEYYVDAYMNLIDPEQQPIDFYSPALSLTWYIEKIGGGNYYRITNNQTRKAMEIQPAIASSSVGGKGWGNGSPEQIEMKPVSNSTAQYWYLR